MSDITLFNRLPDWVVPEPDHLDSVTRPVEHMVSVMRLVECLLHNLTYALYQQQ